MLRVSGAPPSGSSSCGKCLASGKRNNSELGNRPCGEHRKAGLLGHCVIVVQVLYVCPNKPTAKDAHSLLTAYAANSTMIASEITACTIIATFAGRDNTAVSVGDKAVLVLKAKNR